MDTDTDTMNNNNDNTNSSNNNNKQAGAELGQAQDKLEVIMEGLVNVVIKVKVQLLYRVGC